MKSLDPKCLEVFLWIYGRDLVPDEITNSLKLEPTKTHSESNVKQWILNSCNLQPNNHLIKHMDSILDQIEIKHDELEEIRRQGNQTVLYCKIAVDDDQAVFAFDPSLTSRVAKLGLLFTLDVSYPVGQKYRIVESRIESESTFGICCSRKADDKLIKITYLGTGNYSTFGYDGLSRNVSIVETTAGTVTSTKQFVWAGNYRCDERNGSGTSTNKLFGRGQLVGTTKYFYAVDQLNSVRNVTDNSGSNLADYSFDPFGQATVTGSVTSDIGFAGFYIHARSSLLLTPTRTLATKLGRWLSRDWIESPNLYEYCGNRPSEAVDPLGLEPTGRVRYDIPGLGDLHGYIGIIDGGVVYIPTMINCAGFATGAGQAIMPPPGGSVSSMMGALGFHCRPVSGSSCCSCPPGSTTVMLYTDSMTNPWGPGQDVHAFTQASDGTWNYVGGMGPSNQAVHNISSPEAYWGQGGASGPPPMYGHPFCCCKTNH